MKLKEFEGKSLFKEYGLNCPESVLIKKSSDIKKCKFKDCIVKSQVLKGGRKKAGLIKFANQDNLKKVTTSLFKKSKANELLVEKRLDIKKMFFLSLTIDKSKKSVVLLFSNKGGVDIEDQKKFIKKFYIASDSDLIKTSKTLDSHQKGLGKILKNIYRLMSEKDCLLVEANPVILTKSKLYAADAKVVIDDNSLFRHPEFKKIKDSRLSPMEKKAQKLGVKYVKLKGDIGVVGNGAGLVMTTVDMLVLNGLKPQNFLDIGGGHDLSIEKALELVASKNPKKIFVNIFGGITRCDLIAKGVAKFHKKNKIKLVVRECGNLCNLAEDILEREHLHLETDFKKAISKLK